MQQQVKIIEIKNMTPAIKHSVDRQAGKNTKVELVRGPTELSKLSENVAQQEKKGRKYNKC